MDKEFNMRPLVTGFYLLPWGFYPEKLDLPLLCKLYRLILKINNNNNHSHHRHYYYYYYYCYYCNFVELSRGFFPGKKYPVKTHLESLDFQHFSKDMCRSEEC